MKGLYTKIGMKILFISRKAKQCGVSDYGLRLFAILHPHFDITYREVDNAEDCNAEGFDTVLYNYHYATLPFIKDDMLNKSKRHIAIYHEAHLHFTPDAVIDTSIRPLFEWDLPSLSVNPIPVIGSFGFGFPDKNFPRIAEEVSVQFDKAVIRLNIPFAEYGDRDGQLARREAARCAEILQGTKIRLEVDHTYLSQQDLLIFLRSNDINLFLYKQSHGRGISSAIDYALSAYRPIGVSNSEMFRHLPSGVCIDSTQIKELNMQQLLPMYEEHSNKRLIEKYKQCLK